MRLRLKNRKAEVYVPDGLPPREALARTTHLCVGAHQDDVEIMAQHGILECFQREDRWFTGVVVTDGAGSPRSGPYAGWTDARMSRQRAVEQENAARVGGYAAAVQLGYPSSVVKDPAAAGPAEDLFAILEAAAPQTLYLHNPADKHDTHAAVLLRSLWALSRLPRGRRPGRVLGCEVWRGLDWMPDRDKRALSVSGRPGLSAALLGLFDSQVGGGKRYDLATLGRWAANATYLGSHSADKEALVSYAMDLTPLLGVPAERMLDALRALVAGHIYRFESETMDRLERCARGSRKAR